MNNNILFLKKPSIGNPLNTIEGFKTNLKNRRINKVRKVSRVYIDIAKKLMISNNRLVAHYITLTFKNEKTFLKAKNSSKTKSPLRDYIESLKKYVERRGHRIVSNFWVLETQARGVPHYHIFLLVDKAVYIPQPDTGIKGKYLYWRWGMSNHKRIKDVNKISKNYLAKYMYMDKKEQKDFDGVDIFKGLRSFGFSYAKELKGLFFAAVQSRYNYFRYLLSQFFNNAVIKKINGWYYVNNFSIRLNYKFEYNKGWNYVSLRLENICLLYKDDIHLFDNFDDFWLGLTKITAIDRVS